MSDPSNTMTLADVEATNARQAAGVDLTRKLSDAIADQAAADGSDLTQYVSFSVSGRQYGVNIMDVREIKAWSSVTALPNTPVYVRGVLNLRGVIVPIFDLRCRFTGSLTEPTRLHVVVILMVHGRMMGILVDAVSDILTLPPSAIMPVPDLEQREDRRFVRGIVTHSEEMVALLNLTEIFDLNDILAASEAVA